MDERLNGCILSEPDDRDWYVVPGAAPMLEKIVLDFPPVDKQQFSNCTMQSMRTAPRVKVPTIVFSSWLNHAIDSFDVLENKGEEINLHCMTVRGYEPHKTRLGVVEMARIRNSWGKESGENGDHWMSWEDVFRTGEVWAVYPPEKDGGQKEFGVNFGYGRWRKHRFPGLSIREACAGYAKEGMAPLKDDPGEKEVPYVITYAQDTDAERLLTAANSYKGATYYHLSSVAEAKAVLYEAWKMQNNQEKEEATVVVKNRTLYLTPKPRMSGEDVRYMQQRLLLHGYAVDTDGIFGPATDTAVRHYQAVSGLTVDGIVGAKTWAALEGGSKGVPTPTDGPMDADKADAETCWLRMMIGWRYVIGGQGHRLTRDYLAARYADKPAYFSGGRLEWLRGEIARADAMGTAIYCADCSGLFMVVNAQMGLIPIKDTTADGLWRGYCKEISISDLQPGDILFRKSDGKMVHMAVVGTDGVYEAAGTAYGVVFRPWSDMLSRRTWNRMTGKFDTLGAWTHAGRLK